jgi:hypothetical protein
MQPAHCLIFSRSPGKPVRGVRKERRKCRSGEPPWASLTTKLDMFSLRSITQCSVGEPAEGSLPKNPVTLASRKARRASQPLNTTCKHVGSNDRLAPVPGGGGWRCASAVARLNDSGNKTSSVTRRGASCSGDRSDLKNHNNQFYKTNERDFGQPEEPCNGVKLLAMDILAIATMKNAAKCDT